MAKRKSEDAGPSDKIRFVAVMTREERARVRYFCDRFGMDMEKVGARWIMEGLAREEAVRDKKSR